MPSTRAEYYRRQADVCLRLAESGSNHDISAGLVALAQRYTAKAEGIDREDQRGPIPH
jgi:hypothetical protein